MDNQKYGLHLVF